MKAPVAVAYPHKNSCEDVRLLVRSSPSGSASPLRALVTRSTAS